MNDRIMTKTFRTEHQQAVALAEQLAHQLPNKRTLRQRLAIVVQFRRRRTVLRQPAQETRSAASVPSIRNPAGLV